MSELVPLLWENKNSSKIWISSVSLWFQKEYFLVSYSLILLFVYHSLSLSKPYSGLCLSLSHSLYLSLFLSFSLSIYLSVFITMLVHKERERGGGKWGITLEHLTFCISIWSNFSQILKNKVKYSGLTKKKNRLQASMMWGAAVIERGYRGWVEQPTPRLFITLRTIITLAQDQKKINTLCAQKKILDFMIEEKKDYFFSLL